MFFVSNHENFWAFIRPKNMIIKEVYWSSICFVSHGPWIGNFHCDCFNTLRPRPNGRHFADDTFKCIFLNEDIRISIKISLKFVPNGPINNIPSLIQIMAWHRPGDKPLSEPMMVRSLMHIWVTRPQWVKWRQCFQQSTFHLLYK